MFVFVRGKKKLFSIVDLFLSIWRLMGRQVAKCWHTKPLSVSIAIATIAPFYPNGMTRHNRLFSQYVYMASIAEEKTNTGRIKKAGNVCSVVHF